MTLIKSNILTLLWKTHQILELDNSHPTCGMLRNISSIFGILYSTFSLFSPFYPPPSLVMTILHINIHIQRILCNIFLCVDYLLCYSFFLQMKEFDKFYGWIILCGPWNSFLIYPSNVLFHGFLWWYVCNLRNKTYLRIKRQSQTQS